MKIIRPQQSIFLRNAYQFGDQAMLGISSAIGWYLDHPDQFMDEASLWAAHQKAPMSFAILDAAEPKPYAEYLLAGHACSATPVTEMEVTIEVGGLHKNLAIVGKRRQAYGESWKAMDIEPFQKMSLDHAQTWGGPQCVENYLGTGYAADAGIFTLPNVMLRQADGRIDVRSPLAATTPVPHMFQARQAWLGDATAGFGGDYLTKVYPGLPDSVDRRYLQMAAPDQWLASAEWPDSSTFRLSGLHPDGHSYTGSIPAVRARTFAWLLADPTVATEVHMTRKTLWFLPDHGCAIMLFQGQLPLAHLLDEPVAQLLTGFDWSTRPRATSHFLAVRDRRDGPAAAAFASLLDDELMPAGAQLDVIQGISEHPDSLDYKNGPRDPAVAQAHFAQIRSAIESSKTADGQDSLLEREQSLDAAMALLKQQIKAPETDSRKKLLSMDIKLTLENMDIVAADLSGIQLAGRQFKCVRFVDCDLKTYNFSHSDFQSCTFTRCSLQNAQFLTARMTDTEFQRCNLESLQAADLHCAGTRFDHCNMTAMQLPRAQLNNVMLQHCALSTCDCADAVMTSCIISDCQADTGNFAGATIEACIFERCEISNAVFSDAVFQRTSFFSGVWNANHFLRTRFDSVTFGKPITICRNIFEQANMHKVGMFKADLQGSSFIRCTLQEVLLAGTNLSNASFDLCDAPQLILKDANLLRAKLIACSFRQANFYGASLHAARIVDCNMSGADFAWTQQDADSEMINNLTTGWRIYPLYRDAKAANHE